MAKLLLIYDGECRVCRFGMSVVRAFDLAHAFEFCPFGKAVAEERLALLPDDGRYASFHAVTDEEIYSGTDAARKTLEAFPLGRVATLAGLHNLYPVLALSRGLLGRVVPDVAAVVTCGKPSDDQPSSHVLGATNGHRA